MTATEEQILIVIEHYLADHGYPPTLREASERSGFALGTVHKAIWTLIREGYLAGEPGRTLRLGEKQRP